MAYALVYIDGACRNNGSVDRIAQGAIGIVIYKNEKLIGQYSAAIGTTTNNAAEYHALLQALVILWAGDLQDCIIYSDSELVVRQVNKQQHCRSPELQPLLTSVWEFKDVLNFRLIHTPRTDPGIQQADKLCNLTLDKVKASWATKVPPSKRNQSRPANIKH